MTITEATQAVYLERLERLTEQQMEIAGGRTIDEWDKGSIMPPIAFILERAGQNATLLAEQAWELAWKLVKSSWYADGIGWIDGAERRLTPAIQYAIRQCGGEYRMAYEIDEKSFPFLRRDFLAAHERFALEGGDQLRLTDGQAKGIICALERGELPAGFQIVAGGEGR